MIIADGETRLHNILDVVIADGETRLPNSINLVTVGGHSLLTIEHDSPLTIILLHSSVQAGGH